MPREGRAEGRKPLGTPVMCANGPSPLRCGTPLVVLAGNATRARRGKGRRLDPLGGERRSSRPAGGPRAQPRPCRRIVCTVRLYAGCICRLETVAARALEAM